jgi:hypothetical protein
VAPVYFCQERTQAEFLRRARTPVAVTGS